MSGTPGPSMSIDKIYLDRTTSYLAPEGWPRTFFIPGPPGPVKGMAVVPGLAPVTLVRGQGNAESGAR